MFNYCFYFHIILFNENDGTRVLLCTIVKQLRAVHGLNCESL